MTLHYQLTDRDLRAAEEAHRAFFDQGSASEAQPVRTNRWAMYDWMCIVMLMILFLLFMSMKGGQAQFSISAPDDTFLLSAGPALLLFAFLWSSLFSKMDRDAIPFASGKARHPRRQAKYVLFAWAPLMLGCVMLGIAFFVPSPPKEHPWAQGVLAALAPWTAWLWVVRFLIYPTLGRARGDRDLGPADSPLRQPRSLEVDENGIVVTMSLSTSRYYWTYFVSCIESPSLFLIYSKDRWAIFVPKRGLVGDLGVQQFRAVLQAHIPAGDYMKQQGAFPVRVAENKSD